MFGIGGAGLLQFASRPIHGGGTDPDSYRALFLFFAVIVALGLFAYLFSRDSTD
jgi:hypothetical protein